MIVSFSCCIFVLGSGHYVFERMPYLLQTFRHTHFGLILDFRGSLETARGPRFHASRFDSPATKDGNRSASSRVNDRYHTPSLAQHVGLLIILLAHHFPLSVLSVSALPMWSPSLFDALSPFDSAQPSMHALNRDQIKSSIHKNADRHRLHRTLATTSQSREGGGAGPSPARRPRKATPLTIQPGGP